MVTPAPYLPGSPPGAGGSQMREAREEPVPGGGQCPLTLNMERRLGEGPGSPGQAETWLSLAVVVRGDTQSSHRQAYPRPVGAWPGGQSEGPRHD